MGECGYDTSLTNTHAIWGLIIVFHPSSQSLGRKLWAISTGEAAWSQLRVYPMESWTVGPPTAEGSHAANPKINPWKIQFIISQCPFQEPIYWRYLPCRRPIFQAYVRGYPHKIWPDIWYSTSILGSWNSRWLVNELLNITMDLSPFPLGYMG